MERFPVAIELPMALDAPHCRVLFRVGTSPAPWIVMGQLKTLPTPAIDAGTAVPLKDFPAQ